MTVRQARRGRPPVSEQGRREQRLAISREAVRLFRAHGVASTSGAAIAGAAGVSERTLWRLFRSKESCVEPVLSTTIERFQDVLRSWPADLDLVEYLREASASAPDDVRADVDAALAVVRMSRSEPGLRAVWLVLQERAEPTFADVIGSRVGLPADAPEVRVQAAVMNAALRVATDDAASGPGASGPVASGPAGSESAETGSAGSGSAGSGSPASGSLAFGSPAFGSAGSGSAGSGSAGSGSTASGSSASGSSASGSLGGGDHRQRLAAALREATRLSAPRNDPGDPAPM